VRLVVRVLATAAALAVAAALVDGISVGPGSTGELLTLPLFVLTLGLFAFVLNALLLLFTAWLSDQVDLAFEVDGFWSALVGALIVSVVSFLINVALPDKYER
jgi:putative membrane protein